jgi:predicted nuclease with TOPRIM domain
MAQLQQQVERLQTQLSDRDCQVERLQGRVMELENEEKLQGRVAEKENQVEKLQRVAELADTHETQFSLASQMSAVMHPGHQVYHGPNTIENFQTFPLTQWSVNCNVTHHMPFSY